MYFNILYLLLEKILAGFGAAMSPNVFKHILLFERLTGDKFIENLIKKETIK